MKFPGVLYKVNTTFRIFTLITIISLISACRMPFQGSGQDLSTPTHQPARATLEISSTPAKAEIKVNGKDSGRTPNTLHLSPGTYKVSVSLSGYKESQQEVQLGEGDRVSLDIKLIALNGALNVNSKPNGASVQVDNKQVGDTPISKLSVTPGKHSITIRKDHYKECKKIVDVSPGQTIDVSCNLAAVKPILLIDVPNKNVVVFVDKHKVGSGDQKLELEVGKHTISAKREGYFEATKDISLSAGDIKKITLSLKPKPGTIAITTSQKGVKVFVDRKFRGFAPITIKNLEPGNHWVRLNKRYYETFRKKYKVAPGSTIKVKATLEQIESAPPPRRPLAVMIENHPDARPQSGLAYADVVLEAPAEFGISRFIAFFITRESPVVGPVRSARKYFVLWAKEFNPIYIHAGGAPGAAGLADQIGLVRTNALWDGRAFYRTQDRVAPHNLYTSTSALRRYEKMIGRSLKGGTWGGLLFKDQSIKQPGRRAEYINIHFNDWYYAEWRWDPKTNTYLRWMQGEPAIERITGEQIRASTVIVRVHQIHRIPGDDKAREDVQVFGSGPAYIFQDGTVQKATWKKTSIKQPTIYLDKDGKQIKVNKGAVWIQAIPQYGSLDWR